MDPGATLRELFNAQTLDPRIIHEPEWIDALIRIASLGKAQPAAAGVLDAEFAWSILLEDPELPKLGCDIERILEMSWIEERWKVIARLEPRVQHAFFKWIGEREGSASLLLYHAVTEQGTAPELLLPIGLCLGPLMNDESSVLPSIRTTALTRLEPYLAGQGVNKSSGRVWHNAALQVAQRMEERDKRKLAKKVDDLLGALKSSEIGLEAFLSINGIEQRFSRFAEAVTSFLRRKGLNGLDGMIASYETLKAHGLASLPEFSQRIEQARMAMRLALWVKQQPVSPPLSGSLQAQMVQYLEDGSWVDRAVIVFGEWEERGALEKISRDLLSQVQTIRLAQQRSMADALVEWNQIGGDSSVLRVEEIISRVVAPLASKHPVLLLVLDGMSASVFSELHEDLLNRAWSSISGNQIPLAALATIPSVTAVSRKALFSGKLDFSDSTSEQVTWREHPEFINNSSKGKPQLFLKGDLAEPNGTGLSQQVRRTIEKQDTRVVSVLLNVVDDQLSASDQLKVNWRVANIRYLQQILDAASQANRILILASDHGNVIERNQTRKIGETKGGGDRYRVDDVITEPEHERRISGVRIQAATGSPSIVVAATSVVRYHSRKAGYHGGCSDMELVIPLAVYACHQSDLPEGWDYVDRPSPAWWSPAQSLQVEATPPAPQRKPNKPARKKALENNLELSFEDAPQASSDVNTWIEKLLISEVMQQQFSSLGLREPQIVLLRAFLVSMEKWRGNVAIAALAQELGQPSFRLRGAVAQWKRLLNIDGYDIVSEESESGRVMFNKDLALRQFGISER
jgi:hypothetical protein